MERRLFVRFPMSGTAVLQPEQKSPRALDCEVFDVSYGGMGVFCPEQLDRGGLVKFVLLNRQLNVNISGMGRITHCSPAKFNDKDCFRVGIEFINVDNGQVRLLLQQIRDVFGGEG